MPTLQDIARIIPGYAGYIDREKRRDTDKLFRDQLARQFGSEQDGLTRLAQQVAASGKLEFSGKIETIQQGLNRFIARLQVAPRGYVGWWNVAQIKKEDLDALYQFDAGLAAGVKQLHDAVAQASAALKTDGFGSALDSLRDLADNLNKQFDARADFTAQGKRPADTGKK
jgi:hypothetical protein